MFQNALKLCLSVLAMYKLRLVTPPIYVALCGLEQILT